MLYGNQNYLYDLGTERPLDTYVLDAILCMMSVTLESVVQYKVNRYILFRDINSVQTCTLTFRIQYPYVCSFVAKTSRFYL